MVETGITNMPARLQEDEFCADSLFDIGMDGKNIVWNLMFIGPCITVITEE